MLQAVLFPDTDTAVPVTIGIEPVLKPRGTEVGIAGEVKDEDIVVLDSSEVVLEGVRDEVALGGGKVVLAGSLVNPGLNAVLVVLKLPTDVEIVPEGV